MTGRFHQTIDAKLLKEILGCEVELIRAFCKSGFADNFNNHLGLPRWRDIALKAGSIIGFKLKGADAIVLRTLQDKLRDIEVDGIGLRRNEGFGKVAFNHPLCTNIDIGSPSIPIPSLKLDSAPKAGKIKELREEAKEIKEWTESLRRDFNARLLLQNGDSEKWEAVARWLHGAAGESIDELKQ